LLSSVHFHWDRKPESSDKRPVPIYS
jgi:hypothetical protein